MRWDESCGADTEGRFHSACHKTSSHTVYYQPIGKKKVKKRNPTIDGRQQSLMWLLQWRQTMSDLVVYKLATMIGAVTLSLK